MVTSVGGRAANGGLTDWKNGNELYEYDSISTA